MIDVVKLMAIENLQKCIDAYGLEGTLECIERVYSNNEKAKNYLKKVFFEKFSKNN